MAEADQDTAIRLDKWFLGRVRDTGDAVLRFPFEDQPMLTFITSEQNAVAIAMAILKQYGKLPN